MTRGGYSAISVPDELLVDVDRIVAARLLGYRTRSEFVAAAIREKIQATFNLQASATALLQQYHKDTVPEQEPPRRRR